MNWNKRSEFKTERGKGVTAVLWAQPNRVYIGNYEGVGYVHVKHHTNLAFHGVEPVVWLKKTDTRESYYSSKPNTVSSLSLDPEGKLAVHTSRGMLWYFDLNDPLKDEQPTPMSAVKDIWRIRWEDDKPRVNDDRDKWIKDIENHTSSQMFDRKSFIHAAWNAVYAIADGKKTEVELIRCVKYVRDDGEERERRERETLAHDSIVKCLAFSPDGKTLATGDEKGKVRIWRVENSPYECVAVLDCCKETVHAITFSPDGSSIFIGSQNQNAQIWSSSETVNTWSADTASEMLDTFDPLLYDNSGRSFAFMVAVLAGDLKHARRIFWSIDRDSYRDTDWMPFPSKIKRFVPALQVLISECDEICLKKENTVVDDAQCKYCTDVMIYGDERYSSYDRDRAPCLLRVLHKSMICASYMGNHEIVKFIHTVFRMMADEGIKPHTNTYCRGTFLLDWACKIGSLPLTVFFVQNAAKYGINGDDLEDFSIPIAIGKADANPSLSHYAEVGEFMKSLKNALDKDEDIVKYKEYKVDLNKYYKREFERSPPIDNFSVIKITQILRDYLIMDE
jgi:hypothetical protein